MTFILKLTYQYYAYLYRKYEVSRSRRLNIIEPREDTQTHTDKTRLLKLDYELEKLKSEKLIFTSEITCVKFIALANFSDSF